MVQVSNPSKVIFPAAGFTKADLVGHYERVADVMLPRITGRPLMLHRFPNGVGQSGFMQKNASAHFPDFIERVTVGKSDGTVTHPVVRDERGLLYLANQGTVAFHIWTATTQDLRHPDRLIFDLDPAAGDVESARFAARAVGEQLDDLGLPNFLMATGSNGYHVVVPVSPTVETWRVDEASRGLSALLAARHRDRLTLEFRKEQRRGRVFVDWLRNRYSATTVAPWSLRARQDASVAVPIAWEELDDVSPDRWTLSTVEERLREPDPWAGLEEVAVDLEPVVDAVEGRLEEAGVVLEPFDRFRS